MNTLQVVAAIIVHDRKILCVRRSASKYDYVAYKYEFPGGKIEAGESREAALKREIKEELHLEIEVRKEFYTVEHQYPDFFITMASFLCSCQDPSLELRDHTEYQWLTVDQLPSLDWAAADIPIVSALRGRAHELD